MIKDDILEGIAVYLEAIRADQGLNDVVVRPQKSVLDLPPTGSIILVDADELEHQCGNLHRLEPLRLRIQTAGLQGRDTEAHKAAIRLCRGAFPDAESDDQPDAFEDLESAILAVDETARLSFWFYQGTRKQPIEEDEWWEDQVVIRLGLKEIVI